MGSSNCCHEPLILVQWPSTLLDARGSDVAVGEAQSVFESRALPSTHRLLWHWSMTVGCLCLKREAVASFGKLFTSFQEVEWKWKWRVHDSTGTRPSRAERFCVVSNLRSPPPHNVFRCRVWTHPAEFDRTDVQARPGCQAEYEHAIGRSTLRAINHVTWSRALSFSRLCLIVFFIFTSTSTIRLPTPEFLRPPFFVLSQTWQHQSSTMTTQITPSKQVRYRLPHRDLLRVVLTDMPL